MIHARPLRPIALLVLLALGAHAAPQKEPEAGARGGPLVLSLADLVLDQYAVQNVDCGELYQLVDSLAGREYFVKENGASGTVSNLRLLGATIVLYDTKDQVQRMRDLLAKLDAKRDQVASDTQTVEYDPRFVSLQTAA